MERLQHTLPPFPLFRAFAQTPEPVGMMKQARHSRRVCGQACLVAATLALFADSASPGEPRPPGITNRVIESDALRFAEAYVTGTIECARLEAGNTFLREEVARVKALSEGDSAGSELIHGLPLADAEMRRALTDVLQENADDLATATDKCIAAMEKRAAVSRDDWLETRTVLNRTELLLFEIRGSGRVAGQLASLLSVDKRWFWLCGMVAVATLLAVVCHDRRHELRKILNGGRPKAMALSRILLVLLVLLSVTTLATFVMGDRIYQALLTAGTDSQESPRTRIAEEISELESRRAELETAREDLAPTHRELEQAWRTRLADRLPARNRLPKRWREIRESLFSGAEQAAVLMVAGEGLAKDRARLQERIAELRCQEAETRWYLQVRRWIRGLLGVGLLALTSAGGVWYWAGVKRRQSRTKNTCPLCLGAGSLRAEKAASGQSPELRAVRCHNAISRDPYVECDFSFKAAYRGMEKLCFPTLGIPQAGKTHWLAMLYWSLNQGNYPKAVQFERVRSQSSEDFERIVEEILVARIGTAATQQDRIPHPLVFNFRDRDPWGRSNLLVNIFDYSGEVTSEMDSTDYRRRRALDGDGFLFFLDPTFPSEVQAKALAEFREDLRLVQGVRTGRHLRTPVALCLSKIDLLAGGGYRLEDGSDAIAKFYEDLSRIDPSGESTRRSVLRERSRLTGRLREVIWPHWQVERQIDELFGGRYAFFPLTPVGLDGRGETDLTLRTISPFGLLEPLLWLLEMTGYPVLQNRAR